MNEYQSCYACQDGKHSVCCMHSVYVCGDMSYYGFVNVRGKNNFSADVCNNICADIYGSNATVEPFILTTERWRGENNGEYYY